MTTPPPAATDPRAGAAEAALRGGEWRRARELFTALTDSLGGPAYEGVAQASWWLDDGPSCLAARESAFKAYREAGEVEGAARCAAWLGYDAALFGQGSAVAHGWLGRARDLLEALPSTTSTHGWLAVREAEFAVNVSHRVDTAAEAATRAVRIGRSLEDVSLQVVGKALLGLAEVRRGDLDSGMAHLDTAVVSVLSDEVADLMWVGKVCCWQVSACRDTGDLDRAAQWCARVDELCRQHDLAPLFNGCRILYASVRAAGGHWREAETELEAALDRLEGSRRATRLDAVVELGHLRRRQGRLEEAESLYRQVPHSPDARLGLALVRGAHGDAAGGWGLAQDALAGIPVADRLGRARAVLPALRCAIAAGRSGEASTLADELDALAAQLGSEAVEGYAAMGRAVLAAASSRTTDPIPALRAAIRHFQRAGLGFEEAEARILLARTRQGQDPAAAAADVAVAIGLLEPLSAPELLAEARALGSTLDAGGDPRARRSDPDRSPLSPRELEVLSLLADGRSNPEVASVLVLSEHTVHRHVANILTKLDQPSRTAAVAHALRTGLL